MFGRAATFILVVLALAVGQHSPVRAQEVTRITDLTVARAQRLTFEGKNAIKITLDDPSADRLRQFTRDLTGHRIAVSVNQRKLATVLLLAPIVNGNILVAGDFDDRASEALFSSGAVLSLEIEWSDPGK
jgi:hypothetical protein